MKSGGHREVVVSSNSAAERKKHKADSINNECSASINLPRITGSLWT
jgi:hypothetical protein